MEKEKAHPFLGYSSRAERSLWLNRAALKFCQINFLPVVKMTTSGDGIDLKGNKQGNCIFYCQCINFIVWNANSFSAIALGGVSVRVCRYQALRKINSLPRQRREDNQVICSLTFCLEPILGPSAAREMCSLVQRGPTLERAGGVCSQTTATYHINSFIQSFWP